MWQMLKPCANAKAMWRCIPLLCVLGDAVAERPILLWHFDQIDQHVFRADLHRFHQKINNALVECLLHLHGSAAVQRDLNDNQAIRVFDVEIFRA